MERNYKFLDNVGKVFCGVTGGFDTRLNLSTLINKKRPFSCGNIILQKERGLRKGWYSDFAITQKIISDLGLDYRNLGTDPEDITKWVETNKVFIESQKDTIGSPHRYYYYNSVSKDFDIELTGLGGTEFINKFLNPYFRKGGRFDIEEFMKTQGYNDILDDKYYSKEKHHDKLKRYLSGLLEGITYSTRGDLLTYLLYDGTYKNFQNDYIAAVNMLCPVYSPYFEPDFIKLMLETPYGLKGFHTIQRILYYRTMNKKLRDIDTTHGYPPTKIELSNFYRFLRLLNPLEPSLQYYGVIERMRIFVGKYLYRMERPDLYGFEKGNMVHRYVDKDKINKRKLFVTTNLLTNWVSRYVNSKLKYYDVCGK